MVFGQGDSTKSVFILNTIVGILGMILCIFNCFVVCKHPAFQKGGEFYTDPNVHYILSLFYYLQEISAAAPAAPAKKAPTPSAPAKKAAYEANPFDSSDDDMPTASVPGTKKANKKKAVDNPFEDDNPFDD